MEGSGVLDFPAAGNLEDPVKARLLNKLQELCERYRWKSGGRDRTQAVLSLLTSQTCERKIHFELTNMPRRDETKFDPYYLAKSDMATSMIITTVVDSLIASGVEAGLAAEARDFVGTYDVVIQKGNPSLILKGTRLIGRIEVKASWGLPLPQIARYVLNPSPLIISRVMAGTATLVRPKDHESFVKFSTDLLMSKATRILQGDPQIVPGKYCGECGDRDCSYYEGTRARNRVVALSGPAFEEDLNRFFENLPRVCAMTSQLVLNLVNECRETAAQ